MTKDLTGGNPLKVILLFTLPLVLGNLFQQFYALADTIIVGRFCGVSALASVGSTGSINYLILGFVIGICNGFAIPIAQLFGARDYSDLRRHVANAAWLCIAFSVVLTITTVTLTRPLLVLMQTPEDILDGAVIYIGWIFASIPFIFLYNMVASIMRALGDSKTPLYFLILTSALNIGLDLLLTVPLESVGTAMATYSGQNLGAARMDRVRKGVTSALLIATVYSIASALILHFADVAVMSLFLDTTTEVEIVAMGREYLFWNSVFFVPLGALIVWRYSIQGLGFSTLAMMAGVAEMIARTAVAIVLVPMLGYFGAELANPAAWIAACIFLYPAYRWTCHQLDNRLLAARLHIQSESPEHEAAL